MKPITFPVQIGIYGLPKEGKSHCAAAFVKEYGGIVVEPVVIQQLPPKKGEPARYVVDQSKMGHSAYALKNVGLDISKQYRYVKSWQEYLDVLDELFLMAEDSDKRQWLVIDDTDQWRRMYAHHLAFDVNKRAQISKDEWMQAGGDLVTEMNKLKNMFNVLYVNQMKDEFVKDVSTGKIIAAIYPVNAKFLYEIYGRLYKNKETKTRDFDIELLSVKSDVGDDFVPTIKDVTPKKLLDLCGIDEDMR